jgi:two-component system, NarL family, nitrate/nitrite response regulator NarL
MVSEADMSNKIRIAIVDDHPLVREGVAHVIGAETDMEVVAQGATSHDAIEIVKTHKPEILMLDISIPGGGLAALQAIMSLGHNSKILMLTVSDDEADVFSALNLGAQGYILKGIGGTELINALRSVHFDGHYLSPNLGAKLLTEIGRTKQSSKQARLNKLTERESEITALVGDGRSNKEIGAELNLAEKTVKHYLTNLFKKLNVRSRTELAILVQRRKVGSSARPDDIEL